MNYLARNNLVKSLPLITLLGGMYTPHVSAFECIINFNPPLSNENCSTSGLPVSFTTPFGPTTARTTLKINLTPPTYTKVHFQVIYGSTPTGWTVNIGDSATNDGWAGDAGTQSNDAEMEINGTGMEVYGSDYIHPDRRMLTQVTGFLSGKNDNDTSEFQAGKNDTVELQVRNGYLSWEYPILTTTPTVAHGELSSPYLYALNGQADSEGPINYDIYAGFNQVVNNRSDRIGSGVQQVRVIF